MSLLNNINNNSNIIPNSLYQNIINNDIDIINNIDNSSNQLLTYDFLQNEEIHFEIVNWLHPSQLRRNIRNYLPKNIPLYEPSTYDQSTHKHNSECPICIVPFNQNDEIYITKCGHCFCKNDSCASIPEWTKTHITCPICRQDL